MKHVKGLIAVLANNRRNGSRQQNPALHAGHRGVTTHRIDLGTIDRITISARRIPEREHTHRVRLCQLSHKIEVDRNTPILLAVAEAWNQDADLHRLIRYSV